MLQKDMVDSKAYCEHRFWCCGQHASESAADLVGTTGT